MSHVLTSECSFILEYIKIFLDDVCDLVFNFFARETILLPGRVSWNPEAFSKHLSVRGFVLKCYQTLIALLLRFVGEHQWIWITQD